MELGQNDSARRARRVMLSAALMATAAIGPMVMAPMAQAQTATAERSFDIPPQSLADALVAFAAQSGYQVTTNGAELRGVRSNGARGTHPSAQALSQLLAGTGFTFRINGNLVTLEAAPQTADGAMVLGAVRVEGASEQPRAGNGVSGDFGEENGFIARNAQIGTKSDLPIVETPYSVAVVTREQIEQRDAQTTNEALRYVPGVRVSGSIIDRRNDTDRLSIRGFAAAPTLDGTRQFSGGYTTAPSFDPYLLDRVEVLSGPASVLYGQSAPGGAVGFISKRPTETPFREFIVGTGNYGRLYGAFDLSGPIDSDGEVLYRLTGLGLDTGTQVDHVKDERIAIAPAITWKPGENTRLTVLASYQYDPAKSAQSSLPWDGTLKPNPNGQIPTSFFPGRPDTNFFHREQFSLGYDFEHSFSENITIRQNVKYLHIDGEYLDVYPWGGAGTGASRREVSLDLFGTKERLNSFTADNQIEFKFDTGEINHTFMAGLDYFKNKWMQKARQAFDIGWIDFLNPDYNTPKPSIPSYGSGTDYGLTQVGIYAQDVIRYGNWRFVVGGRQDWAENTSHGRAPGSTKSTEKSDAFTWRAGVAYVFDNGFTPYGSFSTSFQPQSGQDFDGNRFVPTTGEQFEVGLKYQPAGLDSFFQISAFQITQQNVLTADPAHPGRSIQVGEIRSRGITPSVTLSLSKQLDLVASYTYLDLEQSKKSSTDTAILGNVPWYSPEHTASLWSNYTFSDSVGLRGLTLGAGVRFVGAGWIDNSQTEKVPSYTLFDAAIGYDLGGLTSALRGLEARVNAQNIFDKTYVDRCNWNACWWGDRRTITATLRYRW